MDCIFTFSFFHKVIWCKCMKFQTGWILQMVSTPFQATTQYAKIEAGLPPPSRYINKIFSCCGFCILLQQFVSCLPKLNGDKFLCFVCLAIWGVWQDSIHFCGNRRTAARAEPAPLHSYRVCCWSGSMFYYMYILYLVTINTIISRLFGFYTMKNHLLQGEIMFTLGETNHSLQGSKKSRPVVWDK